MHRPLLVLLLLASAARADDLPAPRLVVRGAAWAASPLALRTGVILGGDAVAQKRVGTSPLLWGVRLAGGYTTESNRSWTFGHTHALVAGSVAVDRMLGGARLWAQADLGALVVRERLERQQAQRLEKLGFEVEQTGWSLGPSAALEFGVAVPLRGGWSMHLAGGPTVTRQLVSGQGVTRFGAQSELGVGHAF